MATDDAAPSGTGGDFLVHLDEIQAAQVRRVARAWGLTPEQALAGLVSNTLGQCAAGVVNLIPGPGAPTTRGH
jgi:hypothetical protein